MDESKENLASKPTKHNTQADVHFVQAQASPLKQHAS
jgi:hypothetical protein